MAGTKANKALDKKCFFITPISDPGTITRLRMDIILKKLLKGSLENLGYNCFRAQQAQGYLTIDIIKNIIESNIIVVDITDQNPNVFYELAFALTIGKPTIMLQQKNQLLLDNRRLRKSSLDKMISNNKKTVIPKDQIIEIVKLLKKKNCLNKDLNNNDENALADMLQSVQFIHQLQKEQKEVFNVKDGQIIFYEYLLNGKLSNIRGLMRKLKLFAKEAKKNETQTDTLILQALRQQDNKSIISILHSIAFLVNKGNTHDILECLNGLFEASVKDLGIPSGRAQREVYQFFEPKFFVTYNKLCENAYESLRFRLVKDFGAYCKDCKEMVERADSIDSGILTVQTPVDFKILTKHNKVYGDYIDRTIMRIVSEKMLYRRLVLLNHDTRSQVTKIKSFLRKLVTAAKKHNVKKLDHVQIGFVKLSNIDSIYSNIDFHITSTREFSVAFLSSSQKGNFGQSIHVFDVSSDFSSKMKNDIEAIWKNDMNLKLELPQLNKPYREIMNVLNSKIKNIINE